MISYFAPSLPGELMYSRIVRSIEMMPTPSYASASEQLLGSPSRGFGIAMPSWVRATNANVPKVSRLTEEEILTNSLFYVVAPFLDCAKRASLRQRCLGGGPKDHFLFAGLKCAATQGTQYLAICPHCIADDKASGIPSYYRTVHQHPASPACPKHGIHTTRIESPDNRPAFPAIRCALVPDTSIVDASILEMRIAHDLEWLIANGPKFDLGPHSIAIALRKLLMRRLKISKISKVALASHIRSVLALKVCPKELARLGCEVTSRKRGNWTRGLFAYSRSRAFFRYSVCLFAIDSSIEELFKEATLVERPEASCESIATAKGEILKLLKSKPHSADQVLRALPYCCRQVRAADPGWLRVHLPYKTQNAWSDFVLQQKLIGMLKVAWSVSVRSGAS